MKPLSHSRNPKPETESYTKSPWLITVEPTSTLSTPASACRLWCGSCLQQLQCEAFCGVPFRNCQVSSKGRPYRVQGVQGVCLCRGDRRQARGPWHVFCVTEHIVEWSLELDASLTVRSFVVRSNFQSLARGSMISQDNDELTITRSSVACDERKRKPEPRSCSRSGKVC